jgi:hypothetical protein
MAGEPAVITAEDVRQVVRTGVFNGKAYGSGLLGAENQIDGYTCDVYSVNQTHLSATPPDTGPAGKPAWNAAGFQDKVVVRISGKYRPIVPSLLGMDAAIDFKVTAMMSSEGN